MTNLPVLTWEVHENLVDHHSFIQKLKLFAIARGWTCSKEEISKRWAYSGGIYTWITGTEDFLELKSNGFGSQNLINRIRLRDTGSGDSQQLEIGGHKYDTYNTSSSNHPVDQNGTTTKWNQSSYSGQFAVRRTNIPAVWLFGNEKVIFWVMKLNTITCSIGCFGSFYSYYAASETELDWVGRESNGYYDWASSSGQNSVFDNFDGGGIFFRGGNCYSLSRASLNFHLMLNSFTYFTNLAFYSMSNCITKNSFSNIRPIIEQNLWGLNSSGLWQPLGNLWSGRIYTHGLDIGEHLKYGSDEYIVFPNRFKTGYIGYALRIN